jgi:hypothetical protein
VQHKHIAGIVKHLEIVAHVILGQALAPSACGFMQNFMIVHKFMKNFDSPGMIASI